MIGRRRTRTGRIGGRGAAAALALAGAGAGGCSQPELSADLGSALPQERIAGAAAAVRAGDLGAARELIVMLESSDPAVRMIGIRSLERLTGETRGYVYWAPEGEREEAVERWAGWWREQRSAQGGSS